MKVTLLHTADIHRATFDALRDDIAPGAELGHSVRPDWLVRAQGGISPALAEEIETAVRVAPGLVICTCTTISPVAEASGAVRIDWPMMQKAAEVDGRILMAYCLDSTRAPSLALLTRAATDAGKQVDDHPLALTHAWPLFEAGDADSFSETIAAGIRSAAETGSFAAVILAQASMAGAACLLDDLGVPVLASPELAMRAALQAL